MKEYLETKLKELLSSKQQRHIVPLNVSFAELSNAVMADVRKELNSLYREKKIKVEQGLNDKLICLIEEK